MMLPASIQVCPIELPGRGRRRGETGIATVAALADALADGLPLQVRSWNAILATSLAAVFITMLNSIPAGAASVHCSLLECSSPTISDFAARGLLYRWADFLLTGWQCTWH